MSRTKPAPSNYPELNNTAIRRRCKIKGLTAYASEIASPGVDVLFIGDSIMELVDNISSLEAKYFYSAPAVCRRLLHQRMNPTGVQGGIGFVNCTLGGSVFARDATPGNSASFPSTGSGDTYDYQNANSVGTCARRLGLAADASGRYSAIILDGSGATAAQDKLQADGVCMVYQEYDGGPQVYLDVNNGSYPARDAGVIGKLNVSSDAGVGNPTVYGKRTSRIALTKTHANRCAGRGAAAGNHAYIDGYIGFCGDHASGVRSHILTHKGTRLADHWPEGALKSTIDAFCRRDGSLASNARVAVCSFITNDVNNYPTVTRAAWRAAITALVDRCLAQGISKVIWVIPHEPLSSAIAATLADWRLFREDIYTVQATRADDMAIVDMGYFVDYAAYSAVDNLRGGLADNDGLHMGPGGHSLLGSILADYIAWGFGY